MNLPARFSDLPPVLHIYAFPRWKWPKLRQCFPGRSVVFMREGDSLAGIACLVLWGMTPAPEGLPAHVRLLRMEDGFLRSVGLGADLIRPVSWVLDGQGIYYNAGVPSDLETIFSHSTFDEPRAAALREKIVASNLTKYNLGTKRWQRPVKQSRVILVPGQVESDASIRFGASVEHSNMGLLRSVRQENPTAYVIYKPHPDVIARLRKEGSLDPQALRYCDEVVTDCAMGELLNEVDEVHVMTSLAGFEALLRGKKVTCYGQPFYAGWGLTEDKAPHARRKRFLTLDALVAGALIEYPLYLSRDGKALISPEAALEELLRWRQKSGGNDPWWRGIIRVFLRRIIGVR